MNATATAAATTGTAKMSCGVLIGQSGLPADEINRFVLGEDPAPRQLSAAEAAQELGDPFAQLLLLKSQFPQTGRAVLDAFAQATPAGDPLRTAQFFVLGEGSQIPFSPATSGLDRSLRFVVSCGAGPEGPDVILSVFGPDDADAGVELMAWDRVHAGFNFYRTVGPEHAWVFAGNSRHALEDPTQGSGPFESHPSGNLLMKELRAPWINWHSPDANIFDSAFAPTDPRRTHPWFLQRKGANVCQDAVAEPSIRRWARARMQRLAGDDGTIAGATRFMEQILGTPTVNLITSHTESGVAAAGGAPVDLPQTFFVSSRALTERLGLKAPPPFAVEAALYAASLQTFAFALRDANAGFEQPGDTHFAFLVPERALEDDAVLEQALESGLLTPRLAASLLMVDFPNPVWSRRREALLAHVPEKTSLTSGPTFAQELPEAILAAAPGTPEGSPEREFADLWAAGDAGEAAWRSAFDAKLGAYYDAVTQRLATQAGYDDYVRLAESRRARFNELRISEFALLLPHTNIPPGERRMLADGTGVDA